MKSRSDIVCMQHLLNGYLSEPRHIPSLVDIVHVENSARDDIRVYFHIVINSVKGRVPLYSS